MILIIRILLIPLVIGLKIIMLYAKAKKSINLLSPCSNKNKNQFFKINQPYQQLFLLMSLKLYFWNMLLVIILPFVKVLVVNFGGYLISFIIFLVISSYLLIIKLVYKFLKLLIKRKQLSEWWFLIRKRKLVEL